MKILDPGTGTFPEQQNFFLPEFNDKIFYLHLIIVSVLDMCSREVQKFGTSCLCRANAVKTMMAGFCLLMFAAGIAQNRGNESNPAIVQVDALLDSGNAYETSNPAKSIAYYNQALLESRKIDYVNGIVKASLARADYFYGVNLDSAIMEANEALNMYQNRNLANPALEAEIYCTLADAYDDKGKKDSAALYYYLLSRQMEENSTAYTPKQEIDALMKLTVFTVRLYDDTAFLKKTIDPFLERAMKASDQIPDDSPLKPSIHFIKGVYYMGMKRNEQAAQSFILYLNTMGDNISLPRRLSTYVNISQAYLEAKKPVQALSYLDKATAICQQPGFQGSVQFYMSVINLIKGRALYALENYQGAIDLINNSLETSEKTGTPLQLDAIEGHRVLSEAYAALGNTAKTIEHQKIYLHLHDSVLQKDRMDVVSMLEVQHKVAEKNRQIDQEKIRNVETQNRLRVNNFWLILSSCITIILLLLITLWRRNSLHKQRLQSEKINILQKQQEIEVLNAAISGEERERNRIAAELHDGIGGLLAAARMNLEVAQMGTSANPAEELRRGIELVENASMDLRKTAHNMMPVHLVQEGLVAAIRSYCDSLSKNSDTKIKFQALNTPVKLKPAFELSVYRIVQELLHNVLKHAKAKEAIVQLSYYNNCLSVTVEDNGVGMAVTPNGIVKTGIGLTSVQQRVQAIHGSFTLQSAQNEGTSIYMEFEPELISS